jgi:hypothetical protein
MRHPVLEAGGRRSHVRAFEAVATGQRPSCHETTLEWLVNHGLVERLPGRLVGHDHLGEIRVPEFRVPLEMHVAWCEWCAKQPGIEPIG